jgi:hypothetical protein
MKLAPNTKNRWDKQPIPGTVYMAISSTNAWTRDRSFFVTSTEDIPLEGDAESAVDGTGESQWFWAEIPGHVRARWMDSPEWIWESGRGDRAYNQALMQRGLPIRVFIFLPFILLVLIMVGVTATVSLRAAAIDSDRLASNLHQETSDNVRMQLMTSWRARWCPPMPPVVADWTHCCAIAPPAQWPCLHPGRGGQGDCVIGGRRR